MSKRSVLVLEIFGKIR